MLGVSPDKIVTKEQFDSNAAEILKQSPDYILLPETPASDIKILEGLLGAEEGTLPNFTCRFEKGAELCTKCGRHYSILDMAKDGIEFHGKQFVNDTVFGRHEGSVWNDNVQFHHCYNCGEQAPQKMVYFCSTSYGCGRNL